jgi:subtilase family serine protease
MARTRVGLALAAVAALIGAAPAWGSAPHPDRKEVSDAPVCRARPSGTARCLARVGTDGHGVPVADAVPTGLGPASIESVYGFSTSLTAGAGQTIAIVDAYDDSRAERDLGTFASTYHLPACTTNNGCFTKVNQTGGTRYPRSNAGWALEISLDVQWAHAIAPGAKILLVEASTASLSNLMVAEDYASAHAQFVSNSWGGNEFSRETNNDSHFVQPGVSFFVATGDNGLGAQYPAASPNVISVGGTTLHFAGSGKLSSETGWSGSGGGCSAYEAASTAQAAFPQYAHVNCGGNRATPDVALDADPASGVSVYDTTPYAGRAGWFTVGGTSASTPMWAARSADAGVAVNATYVYGSSITYRDITSGNNGAACLVGYDLVTGRGSWTGSTP